MLQRFRGARLWLPILLGACLAFVGCRSMNSSEEPSPQADMGSWARPFRQSSGTTVTEPFGFTNEARQIERDLGVQ
jgi:hypothetical protein